MVGAVGEVALRAGGCGVGIGGTIGVGGGGKRAGNGNGSGMARGEDARDVTSCRGDYIAIGGGDDCGDGSSGRQGAVDVGEEAERCRRVEHDAGLKVVCQMRDSRMQRRRTWFMVGG